MKSKSMQGVYVVEFAIVGLLLFVLLFGVLEMGRLLFTVNVLNESVRRGARLAAVCNIQDPTILRRAVFADVDKATSNIVRNLDTADLTISYLDENGAKIADPSPSGGFSQIRFVQVSIEQFSFSLLIPTLKGQFLLQPFRAILPRESLGRHAEEGVTPEITPC